MTDELDKYLDLVKSIGRPEYQEIARIYQSIVESAISGIWDQHGGKIDMRLNNIPICLRGSAVNTSTAFGFLVEEFLMRQLPDCFLRTPGSTINSAYDFMYKNDAKIELLVNLKVEKDTSNNQGIVAANILKNHYERNNKPKLYLILKSGYRIDEERSLLIFRGISSVYLESFITQPNYLRSDNRNWSSEFNVLSGRIQLPPASKLRELGIHTIPEPGNVLALMGNLAQALEER